MAGPAPSGRSSCARVRAARRSRRWSAGAPPASAEPCRGGTPDASWRTYVRTVTGRLDVRAHYAPPLLERMTARNSAGYEAPVGLAADPVVFTLVDGDLSVLLARRLEEPQRGTFALPGGFVG